MKKILIFAPNAPQSGVTSVVINLFGKLDKKNVKLDIVGWSENSRLRELCEAFNGNYYEWKIFYLKSPIKYQRLLNSIMSKNSYDAVIYNLSYLYTDKIFKIAKEYGIKKIIAYSHNTRVETKSNFKRMLLEQLHSYYRMKIAGEKNIVKIACSKKAAEWMYGEKTDYVILKNAIPLEKFKFNEYEREQIRNKNGIDEEIILGNIGRLSYQKNQHFLIEIFSKIHSKQPNTRLWLFGEGPEHDNLSNYVSKLGLNDVVKFFGNVSNMNVMFNAIDLFLLPSRFEGAPVSAVEAQANGLPCYLSEVISQDSAALNSTVFLAIDSIDLWVETILHDLKKKRESNAIKIMKDEEWDIDSSVRQLEKILNI